MRSRCLKKQKRNHISPFVFQVYLNYKGLSLAFIGEALDFEQQLLLKLRVEGLWRPLVVILEIDSRYRLGKEV